jgi:hypothetical protein
MRTKRIIQLLVAVVLCIGTTRQTMAQYSNAYINVTPIYTQADIVNATALVDPLTEQIKNIAPSSFSLTIQNKTGAVVWVDMSIVGFITLDQDGPPAKQIVTANTTRPFSIPATGRIFTSLDAQQGTSSDIDINSNVDEALKERLKNIIQDPANGGKVPSGVYTVNITMTVDSVAGKGKVPNGALPPMVLTVTVTNPTNATLLQPSDNGIEYPSPFPQFQWAYDTHGVMITIYEKRAEQQSLEDAITAADPYLQVQIDRQLSGNLTILTYPQAPVGGPGITFLKGPRPLERGKSYVIELDGIRTAFGYTIDPLRTLRLFRIADPQGALVINLLQMALSGGEFQDIMSLVQDQKLVLDSSHITLNGVPLSPQELQLILTQYKNSIKSIHFE